MTQKIGLGWKPQETCREERRSGQQRRPCKRLTAPAVQRAETAGNQRSRRKSGQNAGTEHVENEAVAVLAKTATLEEHTRNNRQLWRKRMTAGAGAGNIVGLTGGRSSYP